MRRWAVILATLVAFDALWTVTILGAGRSWWWVGPALVGVTFGVQLLGSPRPGREAMVVGLGSVAGTGLDAAAVGAGVMTYRDGAVSAEFVVVFLALWVNFGATLRPALAWLWGRPALSGLLGGVGGALAYVLGARLGAIGLPEPSWRGVAWATVQYAAATPLWMLAASRFIGGGPGAARAGFPIGGPR